jgi:hypothetical protein
MTDPDNTAREDQERKRQVDAAAMLNAKVKELVGAAVGDLEAENKLFKIELDKMAVTVKTSEDRVEKLELALAKGPIEYKGPETLDVEAVSKLRRRQAHHVSVKGIHTYEGAVEGEGLTQAQIDQAQAEQDRALALLQPIYEEFLEPSVAGSSVGQPVSLADTTFTVAEVLGISEQAKIVGEQAAEFLEQTQCPSRYEGHWCYQPAGHDDFHANVEAENGDVERVSWDDSQGQTQCESSFEGTICTLTEGHEEYHSNLRPGENMGEEGWKEWNYEQSDG